MPKPILRTGRLTLVALAEHHLEAQVELDADPEVLRFLFGRARSRDEVVVSHGRRLASAGRVDGLGYWAGFDGDDFVALMMLPPTDEPGVAELGYRIPRRHWRQGYATEASLMLLRHAFDTVGLDRVIARTMTVNTGSRAVMAKLGLRHIRTFFPTFDDPLPGTDQGEVEYEMTRETWASAEPADVLGLPGEV
ncbi:GNAT family N-acetyltransferase [Actinoplanes sp. NPDC051494]|uniref:GNAT family N-acetyltransferase n=1 Tax=Actinoplanes sp. NPDC051494 TaxID=3363907 RepID=UPI00378FE994